MARTSDLTTAMPARTRSGTTGHGWRRTFAAVPDGRFLLVSDGLGDPSARVGLSALPVAARRGLRSWKWPDWHQSEPRNQALTKLSVRGAAMTGGQWPNRQTTFVNYVVPTKRITKRGCQPSTTCCT